MGTASTIDVATGTVVNTVVLDADAIILTKQEAARMEPEWFSAWTFFIVADGQAVSRVAPVVSDVTGIL